MTMVNTSLSNPTISYKGAREILTSSKRRIFISLQRIGGTVSSGCSALKANTLGAYDFLARFEAYPDCTSHVSTGNTLILTTIDVCFNQANIKANKRGQMDYHEA